MILFIAQQNIIHSKYRHFWKTTLLFLKQWGIPLRPVNYIIGGSQSQTQRLEIAQASSSI